MYVDPHVGSVVDLPHWPRRCQGHRDAVLESAPRYRLRRLRGHRPSTR